MMPSQSATPGETRRSRPVLPIIDVDIHEALASLSELAPFLSQPWRDLVARRAWSGFMQPFVYWAPGGGNRADARPPGGGPPGSDYTLLREQVLDLYSIRHGILTGYFYPVMMGDMQVEFASALASGYNDYQISEWLERDQRLLGSVHVAPQDPVAAAREIDRVGEHGRMIQVLLPMTTLGYGHPYYFPIFEAAERKNLRVAFHHTVHVQGALGMGRYYIERHMLIPQATMAQMMSLYCGSVFDRFPALRFAFLEGGFTWLPHVIWRMEREYKSLRQEIPWVKRRPEEHIVERVKLSTQPAEDLTASQLETILDLIGSDDILMFASDYPHFDFDSPIQSLPTGLSNELTEKILYKNAGAFYGLDGA